MQSVSPINNKMFDGKYSMMNIPKTEQSPWKLVKEVDENGKIIYKLVNIEQKKKEEEQKQKQKETEQEEPVQKQEEPVQKQEEPVQEQQEPVEEQQEPVQEQQEPVEEQQEPVQEQQEPVQEQQEPVQEQQEPVQEQQEPVQEQEEPVQEQEEPLESEQEESEDESDIVNSDTEKNLINVENNVGVILNDILKVLKINVKDTKQNILNEMKTIITKYTETIETMRRFSKKIKLIEHAKIINTEKQDVIKMKRFHFTVYGFPKATRNQLKISVILHFFNKQKDGTIQYSKFSDENIFLDFSKTPNVQLGSKIIDIDKYININDKNDTLLFIPSLQISSKSLATIPIDFSFKTKLTYSFEKNNNKESILEQSLL
jgi:hypothetical protein